MPSHEPLDILILGAGWTSTFLIPLLRARSITFAATTRDGREVAGAKTIPWSFDANATSQKENQFSSLPNATTILITFPLTGTGQSRSVVEGYNSSHPGIEKAHFIQLGSTGIWQGGGPILSSPSSSSTSSPPSPWLTRHSPYETTNARAIAEDELLSLHGTVLNLSGLWGGSRDPRDWVSRVAKSKSEVKAKKSLHLIHGLDVARAILGLAGNWKAAAGQRWMLTDGFVYDWWSLFAGWAEGKGEEEDGDRDREPTDQARWVAELMCEDGVRALPRDMVTLGRCYDSREFWRTFGLTPLKARI